jgi:AraC-like DNA-binding protein
MRFGLLGIWSGEMGEQMEQVRAWLEQAAECGYCVKTWAHQVGIHRRALEREVRRSTGKSPKQVLTELRQAKAFEMLREGHAAKSVAHAVGYQAASQFTHAFKQFHGRKPKQIRGRVSLDS